MKINYTAPQSTKDKVAMDADSLVANLKNFTAAQASAWIDANVTTLAQARVVLKAYAKILLYLVKYQLK